MSKTKILFVTQEMIPYMPETEIAKTCRELPQAIQERGHEIRTFMPKYGSINERRNQLHEVIRLSGMNLIIDDTDHPLIIKVASIQAARMQVYFTDNDDYFQRKVGEVMDEANREDNDERSIFYARGVLETVKNYDGNPISSTVTDGYLLWCHYMSKILCRRSMLPQLEDCVLGIRQRLYTSLRRPFCREAPLPQYYRRGLAVC